MNVAVSGVFLACVLMATACSGSGSTPTTPSTGGTGGSPATASDGTLLLQHLPIDLSTVNYATLFANREGREPDWLPLDDYGRVSPPNSARPNPQANPQPTFYAPLGTPVVAVVSGTVTSVSTLYSNDFSVMISSPNGAGGTWEHEHVINVRVAVGAQVTAGQRIGDVSNYECVWGRNGNPSDPLCRSGVGLVELGLLYSGNPPAHRCPFEPDLVDATKRAEIFGQLDSARTRIKAAFGNPSLFGENTWATPQCVSLARIEG
ncbi:MAG: M23 family metallopeptidase [Vicinamibacterales bacterium]